MPSEYAVWRHRGHAIGYRRGGIYHISRSVGGRRVRITTGCVTEEAALEEFRRFELNPLGWVNRYGKPALPRVADAARVEQLRTNHLARRYRITPAEYDRWMMLQGGRCAICGAPPKGGPRGGLDVDHDHATGQVRGLLCGPCNRGIGNLGDSVELLRKATAYLEARRALERTELPQEPRSPSSGPGVGPSASKTPISESH